MQSKEHFKVITSKQQSFRLLGPAVRDLSMNKELFNIAEHLG